MTKPKGCDIIISCSNEAILLMLLSIGLLAILNDRQNACLTVPLIHVPLMQAQVVSMIQVSALC